MFSSSLHPQPLWSPGAREGSSRNNAGEVQFAALIVAQQQRLQLAPGLARCHLAAKCWREALKYQARIAVRQRAAALPPPSLAAPRCQGHIRAQRSPAKPHEGRERTSGARIAPGTASPQAPAQIRSGAGEQLGYPRHTLCGAFALGRKVVVAVEAFLTSARSACHQRPCRLGELRACVRFYLKRTRSRSVGFS